MPEPERPSATDASAADIEAWNRVADGYAGRAGGPDDRVLAMLGDALRASIGDDLEGLDVLDLGCGHGWLSTRFRQAGARVRGIDGSSALLAHARRLDPDVEFLERDLVADELPDDRRFDRIVAHMVLMDLPEVSPVVAYVARVLKPRGRFVFTLPHPCFFNYPVRKDADTGEPYCAVSDYLRPAEWWIESYGGHRHYHRSLTCYVDALREHGLCTWRMYEAPHVARSPDDAEFYGGISKFMLIEARPCPDAGR